MEDPCSFFLPCCTTNPLVFGRIFGKETCANENGMLSAGRIVDQHASFFDLPGVATILPCSKEFFQFACQARRKTREHCRATSQHDVLNQWNEVINFIGFETFIEFFSKACIFYAGKLGIKHALSSLEALSLIHI